MVNVIEGASTVDESMLTGDSLPVVISEKNPTQMLSRILYLLFG